MSFRCVPTLAWILISVIISGCEWVKFKQEANRLRAMSDSTQLDTTTTDVVATEDANGRQAAPLSTFFGLDDALPRVANRL